ncbi:hypothetical protein IGI04_006931 [Brassica rapa subsp. trilocularis]|uniref:Receptor-like serine/threonine-protein kinase n=1 Tax=Brassica rapa subsp. trilocularis TaxID=1813537 RepID=A0ABQ7NIA5_BRACM|nr:hypothetical protein IGI04_006931 [Brassica rapa subsp. trilocularis]
MSFSHILSVSVLSILLFEYGNSGDILRSGDRWVSVKGGTLVSARETFEAGFFRFAATEGWFLGIWYKNVPERTYVWVGNREAPLYSSNGTLEIYEGQLVIRYKSKLDVWWSTRNERRENSSSSTTTVAQLLENGNLSFDEPTDTILPEMKLLWHYQTVHMNKYLTSWRAVDDPQPGDSVLRFENAEYPVLTTWRNANPIGAPPLFRLTWKAQQVSCLSITTDNRSYTRVQLCHDGSVRHYAWNQTRKKWDQPWSSFLEVCDMYSQCIPNAYCSRGVSSLVCECIPGFEYSGLNLTRKECVRKKRGTCNGDHFSLLPKMKSYPSITMRSLETGNRSCITWSGDLVDIRSYSDEGLDLYVRTAAGRGKKKSETGLIVGTCVCFSVALALFALFCHCKRKKKREERERERATTAAASIEIMMPRERENAIEDQISAPMDFAMILNATDNFSQEIGHGGFGYVYKGVLASGEEIAVKKLSEISKQGLDEFRTEVRSISRLRHLNIVRLYGWSVYKEEKLLIYEYLVNGSLERHLFGGGELNWETRFHIIKGVAQGLAYIEEGGYDLILHRDLKPDNILLDRDMTPKISDFGLARMCARSEKEVFTQHTAGTHGYVSPESLLHGIFSSASDVFSFGVIVLEIVNGKRNRSFSSSIGYLLGYAWNKYNEGNLSEIIDEKIRQDCVDSWQVLRCIEVGLLCSQYFARDRPKISLVVAQLQQETIEIQKPKHPGYYPIDEGKHGIPSSSNVKGESSTSTSNTVNGYTFSEIDAR